MEDKAPPPPPLGFKEMHIFIVAIGDAIGKIFWVCFNAKGDAIKCAVLWNLWEFITTSSCFDGCVVCGMFKSLRQLQGVLWVDMLSQVYMTLLTLKRNP